MHCVVAGQEGKGASSSASRGRGRVGKSMGNPQVSRAIPVPNLPKNPYLLCGYGFSNRHTSGDPYLYLRGFTHGYEQAGSICQRACVHLQTVTLRG